MGSRLARSLVLGKGYSRHETRSGGEGDAEAACLCQSCWGDAAQLCGPMFLHFESPIWSTKEQSGCVSCFWRTVGMRTRVPLVCC